MANEFKHKDPCSTLTQAEYIAACGDGHIFACQATGDIVYASSTTVLSKLAKGAANTVLHMGGSCIPAWTASPSVTDLTIGGGCITLTGAATDIDLIDNNASALSFDASGKAGIIDIVTTNCSEGVTMSGTLGVTGVLTATGGLAGGAICIGSSTITTTGLISGGSLDIDNVLINGTTIGHTCDTDLLTIGDATLLAKGTVTVGVCGTGHDVKFFGCEAGAYVLYDQSEELLEIRGAAADAATSTGKLLLSTALTNINANDVIGRIDFKAPLEAGGTDAITNAASILAVAQATFTCAVNNTDLIFYTGLSAAACTTERFRMTANTELGIGGANYGTDGQVLTSGGAGAAVAWEDAGGAVTALNNATANELTTIGATTTELCAEANLTFDGTNLTVGTGNVIIGTAGKGIDFSAQSSPASGMTSELLDHYEEGTFTVTIQDDSRDDNSQSYNHQFGRYTKIGRTVFVNIVLEIASLGSLATGEDAVLTGIPFTPATISNAKWSLTCANGKSLAITSSTNVGAHLVSNDVVMVLTLWDASGGVTGLTVGELSAGGTLNLTGHYEVP